ncbi:6-phosphofructokinase [Bradyrhizobium sp. 61]|uniref:6-phosphofructokinase n=1 Tax=unclassified Bradyrhizobium TaxID=2631580 RepID=UPI001FFB9BA8|nr:MULTISPECIES: 6-phosphofructokinase [unclassified Bradyrhizobium]MCK1278350.1 6-phosphofructokinase [Bradyrhizobium sp. 61]MCK1443680.1 6-phosphofructokinase [Bradyrhizobium sp. 48]MCK1461786.1 6-phosphofructokinase [Bradyrhizobium sp. 2]
MSTSARRIAINSGGAYVPGWSAVVAGAVVAAHELDWEVFAINNGYEGLLFSDRYPNGGLTRLTPDSVEGLLSGGGDLTTSRVNPFQVRTVDDDYVEEMDRSDDLLASAGRERIDGVISVVGRRAMSVAWKLERKGLKTICVPESVENDVAATAYSFGFNSALEFTIELLDRIRTAARAGHKIAVVEILGEHAGWLALQAGIAALADAILIPEIPYDLDRVSQRLLDRGRHPALVVVAEGARPAEDGRSDTAKDEAIEARRRALSPGSTAQVSGQRVIRRSGAAAESVAPELQRRTNIETFSFVPDQLLRGGKLTAVDRQIGLAYGAAAVRGLNEGRSGEMVAFKPPHLAYVPLGQAVNGIRTVPPASEFMVAARALGICLGDHGAAR